MDQNNDQQPKFIIPKFDKNTKDIDNLLPKRNKTNQSEKPQSSLKAKPKLRNEGSGSKTKKSSDAGWTVIDWTKLSNINRQEIENLLTDIKDKHREHELTAEEIKLLQPTIPKWQLSPGASFKRHGKGMAGELAKANNFRNKLLDIYDKRIRSKSNSQPLLPDSEAIINQNVTIQTQVIKQSSSVQIQSHISSDESDTNEDLPIRFEEVTPPFKGTTSNQCTGLESMKYFINLQSVISDLKDKWSLSCDGPDPFLDNVKGIIPQQQQNEMTDISESGRHLLIKANNTILADAINTAYLNACQDYFMEVPKRPDGKEALLDMSAAMNGIMNKFTQTLKNGIELPSLYMPEFKIPRCPKDSPDNYDSNYFDDSIISPDMFTVEEKSMFINFIGNRLDGTWTYFQDKKITYEDAMGFTQNRSLNYKTFEILLNKLFNNNNAHLEGNQIITWTELLKLTNINPNPLILSDDQNDLYNIIQARIINVNANLYVPICVPGLVQYGIAVAVPGLRRITYFVPEQPEIDFENWIQKFQARKAVQEYLQYLKLLLECIYNNKIDDWSSTFEFISSGYVPKFNGIEKSPIYCTVFFENMISKEEVPIRNLGSKDIELKDDANIIYMKVVDDMTNRLTIDTTDDDYYLDL